MRQYNNNNLILYVKTWGLRICGLSLGVWMQTNGHATCFFVPHLNSTFHLIFLKGVNHFFHQYKFVCLSFYDILCMDLLYKLIVYILLCLTDYTDTCNSLICYHTTSWTYKYFLQNYSNEYNLWEYLTYIWMFNFNHFIKCHNGFNIFLIASIVMGPYSQNIVSYH